MTEPEIVLVRAIPGLLLLNLDSRLDPKDRSAGTDERTRLTPLAQVLLHLCYALYHGDRTRWAYLYT